MLSNQNIPSRAHTFYLGWASCIQHEEWKEKGRNPLKMMFHTWRRVNCCLLSFYLANARGKQRNIHNPNFLSPNLNQPTNFFVSELKFRELEMTIMPTKIQPLTRWRSWDIVILSWRVSGRWSDILPPQIPLAKLLPLGQTLRWVTR